MKITYKFVKGKNSVVEVDGAIAEEIKTLNRQAHASRKKESRRQSALDISDEENENQIADKINIENDCCHQEDLQRLGKAIQTLTIEQIELINAVFLSRKELKEIALETGVSYQAIQNRLNKILKRLKKFF